MRGNNKRKFHGNAVTAARTLWLSILSIFSVLFAPKHTRLFICKYVASRAINDNACYYIIS